MIQLTSVLTSEPYLTHPLPEGLPSPLHNLLWGVAAQFTPSVLGLAVGALVQAPCVDGDDLNEGVLAHFGQQKGSTTGLFASVCLLLTK